MFRRCFAVSLLVCLVAAVAFAATGTLELRVRDARTYQPVPATIKGAGPQAFSVMIDASGNRDVDLPSGDYRLEITSIGYKLRRAHYVVTSGVKSSFTVMLDAENPPPDERPEVIAREARPGFTLLHGYVAEAGSGKPIPGVTVRVVGANVETSTNSRGHYSLSVPNPEAAAPTGWRTDTLIYQKPGYKTEVFENFGIYGEDMGGAALGLEKGTGTIKHDATHKLMREDDGRTEEQPTQIQGTKVSLPSDLYKWLGTGGASFPVGTTAASALTASAITVPGSINVGSGDAKLTTPKSYKACSSKHNCTDVQNYSLENYVTQGLPGEWPAWWDPNAQRAGSVAYRSYGSWYVANPLCPSVGYDGACPVVYDICNTTDCQLYNPWTYPPNKTSQAAVTLTAGVVLSSDGTTIFYAEYAGESNLADDVDPVTKQPLATCGDGNVGEPDNSTNPWPCMKDFVCTGKSQPHTHSRGMCQRGSQRWALGVDNTGATGDTKLPILNSDGKPITKRDWRCILDHYYNANSNSSVVDPNIVSGLGQAGTGLRTAFMQGQATYGLIAYEADGGNQGGIRVANASDSQGDRQLVANAGHWPTFEPGGARLAFYGPTANGEFRS
jgi:hypothetical protein